MLRVGEAAGRPLDAERPTRQSLPGLAALNRMAAERAEGRRTVASRLQRRGRPPRKYFGDEDLGFFRFPRRPVAPVCAVRAARQ